MKGVGDQQGATVGEIRENNPPRVVVRKCLAFLF